MAGLDNDYIKKHEPLWGSWHIGELLGEGSYGKVYKIFKEEWDYRYESALKHITVPTKDQYKEAVFALGSDHKTLENYFEDAARSIISETRLMYALRGNSNIVSYEDHMVQKKADGVGWDILIRMEFVTSLSSFIMYHDLTRQKIIKLGIDICSALEACSHKNIIHRDIKDENIFISESGNFKLGDFGISRILSKSSKIASMRGTPLYMAPEVYRGEKYDARVDVYSLGLVLYRLLNHARLPFMPHYPLEIRYNDSETALDKRMSGETPAMPLQAGNSLGEVILKACAFKLECRFGSASEMKRALENVLEAMSQEYLDEVIVIAKCNRQSEIDALVLEDLLPETELLSLKLEVANQKGNSGGNLINGGLAAVQGPWIYYADVTLGNELWKMRTDKSETVRLSSDSVWFINVVGNWIYYSNASEDDKLYRINIDGGERSKLNDDKSWYINVLEDWIYYSNESDGYKIYKIKADGSFRTRLNSDNSNCVNISGDWIYYSNKSDKGALYKIRTDGSEKTKLSNNDSDCINVGDAWIYYCNKDEGFKLYRMKTDGESNTLVNSDSISNLNLSGDWLYYCNKSDGGKLYKIKTDGSSRLEINSNNSDYINIAYQFIFYCNKSDAGKLYIMDIISS